MASPPHHGEQPRPAYLQIMSCGASSLSFIQSGVLLLVVWTLYLLALFALADFVMVLSLLTHQESDSTMSTSLILIFTSSALSLIYISLHLHLAYRFRQGCQPGQKQAYLQSVTRFVPRLLVIFWIAASSNGLVVAARQPRCLSARASHDLWRAGLSCTLHRSATGMAVGALIVTCILFCSIEVSDRPFHASALGIYRPRQDSSFGLTPSPSELDCSLPPSLSGTNEGVHDKKVLTRQLSDRTFWLQRQNSLSSRNAIYPPCLRPSSSLSRSTQGSLRPTNALPPHASLHLQLHRHRSSNRSLGSRSEIISNPSFLPSVSEYYTTTSISSSYSNSSTSSHYAPTRAPSSVSASSTCSSSSSSSPLSTMRLASQPDIAIIPNRFISMSTVTSTSSAQQQLQGQPPHQRASSFPYTWSPPLLRHAPLSADPAIRALSFAASSRHGGNDSNGSAGRNGEYDTRRDPSEWQLDPTSSLRPLDPAALTTSKTSPALRKSQRPAVPRRAAGHKLHIRHPATAVIA